MSYAELIKQEGEYTYSANIQFDIENDHKLARFIPNETTVELLREYFVDISRAKPAHHARLLTGSYGTGKSHFLTVLSLLLSKTFTNGVAYQTFLERINGYDMSLAADIDAFVRDSLRKPFLVVPIVFDFEDFERCIYFSLKRKLELIGKKVSFKTFYDQALALLMQWKSNEESNKRLVAACQKINVDLRKLEQHLKSLNKKSEKSFQKVFSEMTYGVKYIYEVTNLEDAINQANKAISSDYSGIVFIFDEFGRYIEDNIKGIKVKSVQNMAEFCDHCNGNNHIILVSHKEISQYTQKLGKNVSSEWKKVEGRYKATFINDKQDQCLSLIRNVLVKENDVWRAFSNQFAPQLSKMYSEAADFKGFLIDVARDENPFEGGFPLHPIALYALDKLSKKVAQNERTFFTYLASRDDHSLYRFLINNELDAFHFVGIDEIYDYFVPNIKSVQSDESYEWYRNLQAALAKNNSNEDENSPEVKILKVIAVIGIINDASTLVANKKTLLSVIDYPEDILSNAIDALCERRIIKYSGYYDRYNFYEASIFDVEAIIEDESRPIKNEAVIKTLNEDFVDFVLYPYQHNRTYKITRVFLPVFASSSDLAGRMLLKHLDRFYDGVLVMALGGPESDVQEVIDSVAELNRAIVFLNLDSQDIIDAVKRYIAVRFIESKKATFVSKDPTFEKELEFFKKETAANVFKLLSIWRNTYDETTCVIAGGEVSGNCKSFSDLSDLASVMMNESFRDTLIVNNELVNKNTVSASMNTAKRNIIANILLDKPALDYYGMSQLSPEYICVRSTLVKNGFINMADVEQNRLPDGRMSQTELVAVLNEYISNAKSESVSFDSVYTRLKQPPFGLRNGYLSLLFAHLLYPHKKTLIISSHNVEQELTVELFEEIVRRPADYSFTIASWSSDQIDFMDSLEQIYREYIKENMLSKNRLKAIYDGMLSHYKNVSKFSRTTQHYVSEETKAFRRMMERSTTNYSSFLFERMQTTYGSYEQAIIAIKQVKAELDNALHALSNDLCHSINELFGESEATPLCKLLMTHYQSDWQAKRGKSFDYYTNSFLDFAGKVQGREADFELVMRLSKGLTGIELLYWNDTHKSEFVDKLTEIKVKLDAYKVSDTLADSETRMTLTTANGRKKTVVFDQSGLTALGKTVKNKIKSTFNNYGLAIGYDEKVQILLSMLDELMEGK